MSVLQRGETTIGPVAVGGRTITLVARTTAVHVGGDARGALESLEKAAARKEPTAAYVLNNPLFRFLASEPRYQKVRDAFTAEQYEVRTALSNLAL